MSELAQGVLSGCQVSAARAIRALEEGEPEGEAAIRVLYPHSGRAHVVGITGPPGAGKSTLVDGLVAVWREQGKRVAVIAVDPSSPFSGGAVLADRIRMQRHATDPGVFIRSMATRGQLGGLARSTFEAGVVLDAMGFDVLLIETVGVGQDELEVVELAHTTLVVNVPGLGDEIQALKAGILEIGDIYVLNKADREGADETEKQLRMMLHLRDVPDGAWSPPLLRTVAAREEGIEELVDACGSHRAQLHREGGLESVSAARAERFFLELLRDSAAGSILSRARASRRYAAMLDAVRSRSLDPHRAVSELIAAFIGSPQGKGGNGVG